MNAPRKGYLYIVQSEDGPVKIGISINPYSRINDIETGSGRQIVRQFISPLMPGYDRLERAMHQHFASDRGRGEWFKIDFDEAVRIVHTLGAAAYPSSWKVSDDYVQGAVHRQRLNEFMARNPDENQEQAFLQGMGKKALDQVWYAQHIDLQLLGTGLDEMARAHLQVVELEAALGMVWKPSDEAWALLESLRKEVDADMLAAGLTPDDTSQTS